MFPNSLQQQPIRHQIELNRKLHRILQRLFWKSLFFPKKTPPVRPLEGALNKAFALSELRLFFMVAAARIVSVVSHRLVSMRTDLVSSLVPRLAADISRIDLPD